MSTARTPQVFDPVTITNIISSISTVLAEIPVIGGLFRGGTKHIPYDQAVQKSNEIASKFMNLYNHLPDDTSRKIFIDGVNGYWDWVYSSFGNWWDNAIQKDFATWESKAWLSPPAEKAYHELAQSAFHFMEDEDATRVEELFASRYTEKLNVAVINPLNTYLHANYGTSTAELGNLSPDKTSAKSDNTKTFLIVGFIVAAIVAAMFLMKKR